MPNNLPQNPTEKKHNIVKRFWRFLNQDTWLSWIVSLALLIVLIKFVFFPLLTFATGSELPLVIVESCSMYHDSDFENWWQRNAAWYENKGIEKSDFENFPLKNGFSKGDIMFVWGRGQVKTGDVIIFKPNAESLAPNPIIHRVVTESPVGTKGDNGKTNSDQLRKNTNAQMLDETDISKEQVVGKAVFKIPLIGWVKLIFYEPFRSPDQIGFCN